MSIVPGEQGSLQSPSFLLLALISVVSPCTEQGWTCCPKGWKRFQKSCYFFSNDTMHGIASEQNCTGMGSHLAQKKLHLASRKNPSEMTSLA
uniref:Uncharacterized protein n=1 Tax=Buteo japonicus TaxID=224669 RepID=A0A8C0AN78_9AVES